MTPQQHVPFIDLTYEINFLWDDLNTEIQKVLRSGRFILGEDVQQLEAELADYLGIKHVITVNSGTDALVIGLRALGIGAGDEVITSSFTFFATAEAISLVGAHPVFVDIDPATFNLDPTLIESKITPRTRAILPVHLFGQSADLPALQAIAQKHHLKILEDTAQSFGGKLQGRYLGTWGDIGAFSFFPTKNFGAYGDGGMVITDDDNLAESIRMLRVHGSKHKGYHETIGYTSRLDTLQATILRVKLPHVAEWNAARCRLANRYTVALSDKEGIIPPYVYPDAYHVYHQYTIQVLDGRRDEVRSRLAEKGIDTMIYYPIPVHKMPVYVSGRWHLPATEQASNEVLSLPISPHLSTEQQDAVIAALL